MSQMLNANKEKYLSQYKLHTNCISYALSFVMQLQHSVQTTNRSFLRCLWRFMPKQKTITQITLRRSFWYAASLIPRTGFHFNSFSSDSLYTRQVIIFCHHVHQPIRHTAYLHDSIYSFCARNSRASETFRKPQMERRDALLNAHRAVHGCIVYTQL